MSHVRANRACGGARRAPRRASGTASAIADQRHSEPDGSTLPASFGSSSEASASGSRVGVRLAVTTEQSAGRMPPMPWRTGHRLSARSKIRHEAKAPSSRISDVPRRTLTPPDEKSVAFGGRASAARSGSDMLESRADPRKPCRRCLFGG